MATCGSCGASIFWAVTTNRGRAIPIDADPHPDGNAEVIPGRTSGNSPMVTIHAQTPMVAVGPVHRTHFQTCPHADRHRKRIR